MSGRVRASEPPSGVLAPLHLGEGGNSAVELRASVIKQRGGTFASLTSRSGSVLLGSRGAAALSDWLHLFAAPKPDLELWGIDGIVVKCKVSRSTAYNWTRKDGFPQPVPVVGGNGQVWEARAVRAWVRLQRRKGGRPRKQRTRH